MDELMIKETLRPAYKQGNLDSLCGVYCVVNAVSRLCGPLPPHKATALFKSIIIFLKSRSPLEERIVSGTVLNEIGGMLRHVVCNRYPIQRSKPFHALRQVSVDLFWILIQDFLDDYDGIVLTGIGGFHEHWTLIHKATDRSLQLYDSSGMHRLNKQHCTVDQKNPNDHRHILYPTHTYFLWVDKP